MPGEERVAQHVVTSENREAFMAKRLDIAQPLAFVSPDSGAPDKKPEEKKPEAKAEEKKEEKKAEPVKDEDEQDDEVKEVKKRNPKIEARFSDLTKARKEAEAREAAALEREKKADEARQSAERDRDALKAKYEAPKPLGEKPARDKFASDDEFANALEAWAVRKGEAEANAKREHETRAKSWNDKVAATRKETADYDAKLSASQVMLSEQVRDAIYESDIGPKLLYHFAEHPEDAEKIAKLTVGGALREVGRLEERLARPSARADEPKKEEKQSDKAPIAEISKAPAPIAPLKGSAGAPDAPVNDKGEVTGDYQAYKAARKAGKIK